jgi:N-acetylglucosaminyl-diphospho-decaprenol L-rhamnosyltransferase
MIDKQAIDLSIIIVSWNVCDLLRKCLKSIEQGKSDLNIEVIVVDNASSDGSQNMVRDEFPTVKIDAQSENVGFPRGNNLGLENAKGRYFLLLNPDTEVVDDALSILVQYLEDHPAVGLVAGQLLNPDETIQSSIRRFPTVATGLFESTWLQGLAPRRLLDRYYFADAPTDTAVEVDWVVGACMMVRKELIEQVGLLDEAYYMYSEELDWCKRIKSDGWQIVYLPTAQIIHHAGKSSEQAVPERHVNFQRAKLRYFRKYHGSLVTLLIRVVLLANYFEQLIIELIKGLFGHKRDMRRQRVAAYWKVLRSGLPPAGY